MTRCVTIEPVPRIQMAEEFLMVLRQKVAEKCCISRADANWST